ncbi:hypothetical protein HGP28_04455 [Vibrio sp. SM6]|uniref:Chitin-binding type-3 domain-containing protein n=1 Tax=Vibrio agarilyticus TaxID=2726741 RepID=A0A7X8YG29_9VIBR|nr:Ig-like domain-containing protein [Vibrio agarilyticus]NLS12145.1 hypothetical protein [Vibrio agarilyticus]
MKKINKITLAISSILLSGYFYSGSNAFAATQVTEFIPGTTKVQNGAVVSYGGECFIAKNNPGVWETPNAGSWFWDTTSCDSVTEPDTDPETDPEIDVGEAILFIPGQTKVKNGDLVKYQDECFIAKNNPGVWETPASGSWFWDLSQCPTDTDEPEEPQETTLDLLAPTQNQVIELGSSIEIHARVTGANATKVVFFANNQTLSEQLIAADQSEYRYHWTPKDAGQAKVQIKAFDKDNQVLKQDVVSIVIEERNAGEDFVAPQVSFVTPTNGARIDKGELVTITLNATDKNDDLHEVLVSVDGETLCQFDGSQKETFNCQWQANQAGQFTLDAVAVDAQNLRSEARISVSVQEVVEPPVTAPDSLCDGFNLYPDWPRGNHATGGDIMVFENIAYVASYWTQSVPGSDDSWKHHLNCDGTEAGTAPLISLPNRADPVSLALPGWPSKLVVMSAAQHDLNVVTVNVTDHKALADSVALTAGFVALIERAEQFETETLVLRSDVLNRITADKALLSQSIDVKQSLMSAAIQTGSRIDTDAIEALTDDIKGWAQAHHLIISSIAPKALFGWSVEIGEFAFESHSGRQSVWNKASKDMAQSLHTLELYSAENERSADFIAFTKSNRTAALNEEQWHNALEYVKQVSDFVNKPAMLSQIPTQQALSYFMGATSAERKLRKVAYSNVFALQFDTESAELNAKLDEYSNALIPLYYVQEATEQTPLTSIARLNQQLIAAEDIMNNKAFLYETPQSQWIPSTVYKWADFLEGLNSMHNIGVAGNKFWLIDKDADDETNIKYAKVAIAAFLAQSMQETIRYNACDENNWSEVRYGAATDYPMTASCGQLGQKYADYGVHPISGRDHAYSCPRDNKMEVSALTHAKWYGAPAPVFAAPNAVLEERGLLVNGHVGRWTNNGHCNQVPTTVDTSKQVWERDECQVYVDQKAGKFIWDGSSQDSVEGCGWWGRGVIQTTGRQNFGTLNHYLGRSHVDPASIGQTIDGVTVDAPPANPLYAELDFCSNPGLICSSEENAEIKWIAGLFYWVTSVQNYPDESGLYGNWNYHNELKKYVDGGMVGTEFIDDVSGIVNRGCPDLVCSTGEVHNVKERRANFKLALEALGLTPR